MKIIYKRFLLLTLFGFLCTNQALSQPNWNRKFTQVKAHQFDKAGRLVQIMQAQSIQHLTHSDKSMIQQPQAQSHTADHSSWQLSAKHATAYGNRHQLQLQQHVRLQQTKQHRQQWTLHTSELTINLDNKIAQTDQAVTLTSPDSTIHSIGLTANLKKHTLRFHHRVTTTLPTPHSKAH